MERLSKSAPTVKLSEAQKKEMAELESLYSSKIAQREIFLKGELAKAEAGGDVPLYGQAGTAQAGE